MQSLRIFPNIPRYVAVTQIEGYRYHSWRYSGVLSLWIIVRFMCSSWLDFWRSSYSTRTLWPSRRFGSCELDSSCLARWQSSHHALASLDRRAVGHRRIRRRNLILDNSLSDVKSLRDAYSSLRRTRRTGMFWRDQRVDLFPYFSNALQAYWSSFFRRKAESVAWRKMVRIGSASSWVRTYMLSLLRTECRFFYSPSRALNTSRNDPYMYWIIKYDDLDYVLYRCWIWFDTIYDGSHICNIADFSSPGLLFLFSQFRIANICSLILHRLSCFCIVTTVTSPIEREIAIIRSRFRKRSSTTTTSYIVSSTCRSGTSKIVSVMSSIRSPKMTMKMIRTTWQGNKNPSESSKFWSRRSDICGDA